MALRAVRLTRLTDLKVSPRHGDDGRIHYLLVQREMAFTLDDLKYATRFATPLTRI